MSDTNPERIAFEAKVAFLERAVEVMHEVVREQGRSLFDLEQRIEQLECKLAEHAEEEGTPLRPHDDPPPHY